MIFFPSQRKSLLHYFALFVHSSQQREERTKKRRRGYRAFGFVAAVAVGVCGTRSARTVLALFPPSLLRLRRPIKAESGVLACILTPSPFGHSPYIPLRKHRGRGGVTLLLPLQVFLTPLLVATLLSSPLYFALQNAGEEGNTSFGNEVGYRSFFFAVL